MVSVFEQLLLVLALLACVQAAFVGIHGFLVGDVLSRSSLRSVGI